MKENQTASTLLSQTNNSLGEKPQVVALSASDPPTVTNAAFPLTVESKPKPLNMDLLVKGPQLLKIVFAEESRPSMQWLRAQVKARSIPYFKRGRLLFFRPRTVFEFFAQKEVRPSSMKLPK